MSQNWVVQDQKITLARRGKASQMRVKVKMRVIRNQRTKTIRMPTSMAKASPSVKNMIQKLIKMVRSLLGSRIA